MMKADNDNKRPGAAADSRSAAAVIDLMAFLPFGMVADRVAQEAHVLGAAWWGSLSIFLLVLAALSAATLAAFESSSLGATPGKLACGLRVKAAGGGRASYRACFKRNFLKVCYGIWGIPFLVASGWAPGGALHDRKAGTVVVPREGRR